MTDRPARASFLPDLRILLFAAASGGLVLGGAGWIAGQGWAEAAFAAGALAVLAGLLFDIVRSLARGEVGLDIVAALSMAGALVVGETLAAAIVALMYAGGQRLEAWAGERARAEMTALLSRAPRTALRIGAAGLAEVPVAEIAVGDRLLIRQGDVVPADGRAAGGPGLLDLSALTGESVPVRLSPGDPVPSGAGNPGDAFEMLVERRAEESTYAGIVRLVAAAEAERPPMARMADRWALGFLGLTLALAGLAWALAGEPARAVAVLVIATPCPLILAVPVALVAGLSRAARHGLLVKGGGALERLGRASVLILDKTGTLTAGRAAVMGIRALPGFAEAEVLAAAAALDQASGHAIAGAIVAEARARGLALPAPEAVQEDAGDGIRGRVAGREVAVGGLGWLERLTGWDASPARAERGAGAVLSAVALDGRPAGWIALADPVRPEAAGLLAALRGAGIARIVLASGDRQAVADGIAAGLGLDRVAGDLTPAGKVAVIAEERAHGAVVMVGDGVNDAPALAAADLGIAMGARGSAASVETAAAVILVDRLGPLLNGIRIARETRAIALQSVAVGLGLSLVGMLAAALGFLPAVAGALAQEVIDVAVILNALRAMGPRREA